jgi:hypothetical protein
MFLERWVAAYLHPYVHQLEQLFEKNGRRMRERDGRRENEMGEDGREKKESERPREKKRNKG